MPSCRFKHLEGDSMDGQVLRNAGIINADAIIIGNAHDADPKDVRHPPPPPHAHPSCVLSRSFAACSCQSVPLALNLL